MSFNHIFYGGGGKRSIVESGSVADGVIYAIEPNGNLLWYQDVNRHGQNGPNAERGWAPGSGNQIGIDWNFAHFFVADLNRPLLVRREETSSTQWLKVF